MNQPWEDEHIKVDLFINNALIEPAIAKDMMLMLGWEDTDNTIIKQITKDGEKQLNHPISGFYEVYAGNDFVFLTVSKNRNLSIFAKNNIDEFVEADYIMNTYYFSSIMTELELDSLNLKASRYLGDDFITVTWTFDEINYKLHIGFDL